jgi:23S rRNA (cytidine1920-2'-O)/16S rRNA (cytidine1409-2'-O)-methyltransferase
LSERLDVELVIRDLARSRSHAATLINDGRVLVNGHAGTKPAQKIQPEDVVEITTGVDFVSRAGHKLSHAISQFEIAVSGQCLDAGASTGGFTQVLLEEGAAQVVAVDVGHGQLVPEIANDVRVISLEGENIRNLDLARLAVLAGVPINFSLVVVDLSFISLTVVVSNLAQLGGQAKQIWLIKPQFEVGKHSLSASGVVSAWTERERSILQVLAAAKDHNLGLAGLIESPIRGTNGNREYLALLIPGQNHDYELLETIPALCKSGE